MSEKKTEVKTYRIDFECDVCHEGMMERDFCFSEQGTGKTGGVGSINLMSHPPQYPHKCINCGAGKLFQGVTYPRITYGE